MGPGEGWRKRVQESVAGASTDNLMLLTCGHLLTASGLSVASGPAQERSDVSMHTGTRTRARLPGALSKRGTMAIKFLASRQAKFHSLQRLTLCSPHLESLQERS
jgi:hypothetical protein